MPKVRKNVPDSKQKDERLLYQLAHSKNDTVMPVTQEPAKFIGRNLLDMLKRYGFSVGSLCVYSIVDDGLFCDILEIQKFIWNRAPQHFGRNFYWDDVRMITMEKLRDWWLDYHNRKARKSRELRGLRHVQPPKFEISGDVLHKRDGCAIRGSLYLFFSRKLGFPLDTLKFVNPATGNYRVKLRYPALRCVLRNIVSAETKSGHRLHNLTTHIRVAYEETCNPDEDYDFDINYEMITLSEYKEFSRVQTSFSFSFDELGSKCWFDTNDHPDFDLSGAMEKLSISPEKQLEDLISKLVIASNWRDPQYTVRCGFPAGSIFLKATAPPTPSKPQGGLEYIYVDTLADRCSEGSSLLPRGILLLSVTKIFQ